jgi:hypothetical protein
MDEFTLRPKTFIRMQVWVDVALNNHGRAVLIDGDDAGKWSPQIAIQVLRQLETLHEDIRGEAE